MASQRIKIPIPVGINTTLDPIELPDNIAQSLINVEVRYGNIQRRKGFKTLGRPEESECWGLWRFYSANLVNKNLIVLSGTTLYYWNEINTYLVLDTGYNAQRTEATTFDNVLYIANGSIHKRYDFTSVFNWGVAGPTAAPTAVAGAAGNPNGTYYYSYSYGTLDGRESNMSPESTATILANQKGSLSVVSNSSDSQVTKKFIYRRIDGSALRLRVGTINDNTTTTFTDDTINGAEGASGFLNHDPPVGNIDFVVAHKGRLFTAASKTSRLYISNLGEPEYFPVDTVEPLTDGGFIDVGDPDDGDSINGLVHLGSVLVIFKTNSTYILYGDSFQDFRALRVSDKGSLSPRGFCNTSYGVFVLSSDGVNYVNESGFITISDEVKPLMDLIIKGNLNKVLMFYYDNYLVLFYNSVADPSVLYNNAFIWYDLISKKWVGPHEAETPFGAIIPILSINSISIARQDVDGKVAYAGSWGGDGTIYQYMSDTTDELEFGVQFVSKALNFGDSSLVKRVRQFKTIYSLPAGPCDVQIQTREIDSVSYTISDAIPSGDNIIFSHYNGSLKDFPQVIAPEFRYTSLNPTNNFAIKDMELEFEYVRVRRK